MVVNILSDSYQNSVGIISRNGDKKLKVENVLEDQMSKILKTIKNTKGINFQSFHNILK